MPYLIAALYIKDVLKLTDEAYGKLRKVLDLEKLLPPRTAVDKMKSEMNRALLQELGLKADSDNKGASADLIQVLKLVNTMCDEDVETIIIKLSWDQFDRGVSIVRCSIHSRFMYLLFSS